MKSSSSVLPLIISAVVVLLGLAMLGVAAAAILRPAASSAQPTNAPVETHIIIPTSTTAPTSTPSPTATPITPTATSTPDTTTATATATIALPATTAPQSTQKPQATQPPRPTNTPVPPTSAPASTRIANPSFAVETTTIGVNQKIWFTFSVTNASTTAPLPIGELGAVVFNSAGQNIYFQESWSGFELSAGQTLNHRDGVPGIGTPGTYTIRLTICYSSKTTCGSGGEWELLAQPATITIQ